MYAPASRTRPLAATAAMMPVFVRVAVATESATRGGATTGDGAVAAVPFVSARAGSGTALVVW